MVGMQHIQTVIGVNPEQAQPSIALLPLPTTHTHTHALHLFLSNTLRDLESEQAMNYSYNAT